jgi:putative transcriptional regulator
MFTLQTILALEQGDYTASLELAFKLARLFRTAVEEDFHYGEERQFGPSNRSTG